MREPKFRDEAMIWLCGAACAGALFMILMLLAVLLLEGATCFWPRPLEELRLKDGSLLAGPVRNRERYRERDAQGRVRREVPRLQLMTANRDLAGQDFVWVDLEEVASAARPADLLYVERMEWGPLIGRLARLDLAGRELAAGQAAAELPSALAAARARRLEIRRLEARRARNSDPNLEERLAALQAEDMLYRATFTTTSGDKELPISQIVRVHAPNALGFFGKLRVYLDRLWEFIASEPRESNTEGGVFPAIFGTVLMTLLMCVAVVPLGVLAALYLREYARQGWLTSAVRVAVNNLAGVPSIVFGVFGLGFFVYGLGGSIDRLFFAEALPAPTFGTGGILWASLTLALLTVPVVVVAAEEALAFVPRGIRDGALACGATKWQAVRTVVLPAAAPGILTGVILAMARGAGEVAPLMITGVVKLAPELPLDGDFPFFHPERKFMHLGFHIYDVGFQSPNVEAALPMVYATALLLLVVVVGLNLAAMVARNALRRRYKMAGV